MPEVSPVRVTVMVARGAFSVSSSEVWNVAEENCTVGCAAAAVRGAKVTVAAFDRLIVWNGLVCEATT